MPREGEGKRQIMEDVPVVCYWTGSMNSVLDKLAKLKNPSNPTDEFSVLIESLKADLLGLKVDFCDKLTDRREMHMQAKVCMKQLRDLVFNIEDWISRELKTNLVVSSSLRQKFQYFKAKIHGARERFTRYFNLHKIVPTKTDAAPSKITINPRLLVEEKTCHGLLDGPQDELVKYLTDDKEEMRKVVSVIGRDGLGKSTLAKEIYSKLQVHRLFQCRAFISVGRTTPTEEILYDILRQVKPGSRKSLDMQQVIKELSEHLSTKRYFILVDGIWSTLSWKVINCVLPNSHGRVMTTTCIMDVGRSCCSYPNDLVYQMEALSKENSRILFLSRINGQQERIADFEEVCATMLLNICGGVPLAISVAANFLVRNSEEPAELHMLGKFILSSLDQYSTSEGMTKILHMSYADLSIPLRSCFLYIGVFPENYTIKKDRLIQLWGAEGFIPIIDEECLWVTGESYFNELISRRLIQPVFTCDNDQAVGCTVHIVIFDFIRSMSREENFATRATELSSSPFPCDTIRRFSLDRGKKDEAETLSTRRMHLSCMRSLIVLEDVKGMHAPPAIGVSLNVLSAFKLLRVLDLEDTQNLENEHLKGIGGLVLLRYLGLGGTGITVLPNDIVKLEQLETLYLKRFGPTPYLPASVVKLQKLKHLLLEVHATKIWEMPELESASDIVVESSSSVCKVAELLRKSERLRMLGLIFRTSIPTEKDLVPFFDEVVKSKLQSLSLDYNFNGYESITLLVDSWEKVVSVPLGKKFQPRRFEIRLTGEPHHGVPQNMRALAGLTHLHLNFSSIGPKDIFVLGDLTNLILLKLTSLSLLGGLFFEKGTFPSLKLFSSSIEKSWAGLHFEVGSMPQLKILCRYIQNPQEGYLQNLGTGIEHLTCLTRVHAIIVCKGATVSEVQATENGIRRQISVIPTKPSLELRREYEDTMRMDERDDNQIWEDEEQHSVLYSSGRRVFENSDKSTQQLEYEDKNWKEESKKEIFENVHKHKVHRRISSTFKKLDDKLEDIVRKLIGRPKVSENSKKHNLQSSKEDENQVRKDKGKHSIHSEKTSVREHQEIQVEEIV